jgi:CHAD domain-containing protein
VRDRLLAQIDVAARRLQQGRSISDEDVHEARKAIKRARAVLKLLQPALDADDVASNKVLLRDAGRALSSVRDAKVMADRFVEMLERVGIDAFPVRTIAAHTPVAGRSTVRVGTRNRSNAAAARAALLRTRRWLAAAPLSADGRASLDAGIRGIYRTGRRKLPADASAASTEAMHEWRKRVKDYQYSLEALAAPKPPPQMRRTIVAARRLADALGEEHDLALLADALRASNMREDARVRRMLDAIKLRRRRLRRRALKIGSALYAETPAAMARNLRHQP